MSASAATFRFVMNTKVPVTGTTPVLKLPRRPVADAQAVSDFSSQMGGQLAADLEGLREREMNLRGYEERLRAWQAQLDAALVKSPVSGGSAAPFPRPASGVPFAVDTGLEAAWQKFHRARALLEAEQNQLRDDRMAVREMEVQLQRREAELAEREAAVALREQQLEAEKAQSTMQRLTQAPFVAARAVFKPGR